MCSVRLDNSNRANAIYLKRSRHTTSPSAPRGLVQVVVLVRSAPARHLLQARLGVVGVLREREGKVPRRSASRKGVKRDATRARARARCEAPSHTHLRLCPLALPVESGLDWRLPLLLPGRDGRVGRSGGRVSGALAKRREPESGARTAWAGRTHKSLVPSWIFVSRSLLALSLSSACPSRARTRHEEERETEKRRARGRQLQ